MARACGVAVVEANTDQKTAIASEIKLHDAAPAHTSAHVSTRQHAVLRDARSSLHPPVNAFQLLERLARQRVPHVNFWVLA